MKHSGDIYPTSKPDLGPSWFSEPGWLSSWGNRCLTFDYEGQQHSKVWLCSDNGSRHHASKDRIWRECSGVMAILKRKEKTRLQVLQNTRRRVFQELREKSGKTHLDYVCGHVWSPPITR